MEPLDRGSLVVDLSAGIRLSAPRGKGYGKGYGAISVTTWPHT